MDQDEFESLFGPFADVEPDASAEGFPKIACPFKPEDDVFDALGLQGLSFCHDHSAPAAITPHPFESLPPLDDADFCIPSQDSESGLFGSLEDSSWAIEKLDFLDSFFTLPPAAAISPESAPSPPCSPDVSISPPSSSGELTCSPDSSPRSPGWTYDSFTDGVSYDKQLEETLQVALGGISQGVTPAKDQVLAFVLPGRKGGFVCAVDSCEWHLKGWKREDRGISHVLKEHFRVLNFPCEDCNRVYKWPHDLTKHRLLKHSNPGDKPVPQYICPESHCGQTFDKSYNLTRHRRNVHRKSGRTSKAKTRREH